MNKHENDAPAIQNILMVSNKYNYDWQFELCNNVRIQRVFNNKELLLKYVRKNDTIYIPSMLVLDGNTIDNLNFLEKLVESQCTIISCLEPMADYNTSIGKLISQMLLGVNNFLPQIQRNFIE